MRTYTTLFRGVLDLSGLNGEQRAYFEHCYLMYASNLPWGRFANLVSGIENPLVRDANGWVTRIVYDHPLYQAVRDLEDRLGLRQGELAPEPGLDADRDPLDDRSLSVADAARDKGVSVSAIHQAIECGDLIAQPAKPGGSWLAVSANSLARWTPNRVRQAAGRRAARAR